MTTYSITPSLETLHGYFSPELPPVLTVDPGDTVRFQTLAAGWQDFENPDPFEKAPKFPGYVPLEHPGHALCGPVAVRGARPGMALAVHLKTIRPGRWGYGAGGGYDSPWNARLGLVDGPEFYLRFAIDPDRLVATNRAGQSVPLRPMLGVLGMPPNEPGRHSTFPPRACGGNIDCKELVQGSTLYLPISVNEASFSCGDGHAVQGDGEVAGPSLECPMELVEIELGLEPDLHLKYPRAVTPAGWVTFGFHEDLHEALMIALDGMLEWMGADLGLERKEALAFASMLADMHVTQIVNGVRGVHAMLSWEAMEGIGRMGGGGRGWDADER